MKRYRVIFLDKEGYIGKYKRDFRWVIVDKLMTHVRAYFKSKRL